MSVEYEWRFGENSLDQEHAEHGDSKRRPRWRTWVAVLAVALLLVALGVFGVWRMRRASIGETAAVPEV